MRDLYLIPIVGNSINANAKVEVVVALNDIYDERVVPRRLRKCVS
jgi:hypothetical protein